MVFPGRINSIYANLACETILTSLAIAIQNWSHGCYAYQMVCMRVTGWSECTFRVTIVESEEDNFKSEFHRNRNQKGIKDTRSKDNYSEVVWANGIDNYFNS